MTGEHFNVLKTVSLRLLLSHTVYVCTSKRQATSHQPLYLAKWAIEGSPLPSLVTETTNTFNSLSGYNNVSV